MKIAVRMDDIAPGMDWKKFNDFKELLDEYGIKPLIGVVPDNRMTIWNVGKKTEEMGLIGYLRTFGDISDNCRSRDG